MLIKDEEIYNLKTQLTIARKTNIEDNAIIDQIQYEFQQQINHNPYERQIYQERIDHLQKEIEQNFDRLLTVNQKRKTPSIKDQQSNSQQLERDPFKPDI